MLRGSLFTLLLAIAINYPIFSAQVVSHSCCPREWITWYTRNAVLDVSSKAMAARAIVKKVLSVEQAEGVGAHVRRSVGRPEVSLTIPAFCRKWITSFFFQLKNLDPFLLLDEFKVRKPAGFPDHPHRGFETVRGRKILT